MNVFGDLGPETLRKEYKEAVLTHFQPEDEMWASLYEKGILSPRYESLIERQLIHDLWKYLPKYISCFYNANKMSSWYYGVSDKGIITGIPITLDRINRLRDRLSKMMRHLVDNNIAVVIDKTSYPNHIKSCNGNHSKTYYRHNYKFVKGYLCENNTRQAKSLIRFHLIPLSRPTIGQLESPSLTHITSIRTIIEENMGSISDYKNRLRQYKIEIEEWMNQMKIYGVKIETLLSNPYTREQFEDFMKDKITRQDYCFSKTESCYYVGNTGIKNPPFIDILNMFRDINKTRIRKLKPVKPEEPKDKSYIYRSRLAYLSYLTLDNLDVRHVIIKMSLLKRPDLVGKLVYMRNNHWQYLKRSSKTNRDPECIGG